MRKISVKCFVVNSVVIKIGLVVVVNSVKEIVIEQYAVKYRKAQGTKEFIDRYMRQIFKFGELSREEIKLTNTL